MPGTDAFEVGVFEQSGLDPHTFLLLIETHPDEIFFAVDGLAIDEFEMVLIRSCEEYGVGV